MRGSQTGQSGLGSHGVGGHGHEAPIQEKLHEAALRTSWLLGSTALLRGWLGGRGSWRLAVLLLGRLLEHACLSCCVQVCCWPSQALQTGQGDRCGSASSWVR